MTSLVEKKAIFTSFDLSLLDRSKVPKHVAVIMDGNRRWAKENNLPPVMGHWQGAEVLIDIVKAASELGIETVTAYSFSTENWNRSPEEVEALMQIMESYLREKKDLMVEEGICLGMIGDISKIPDPVQKAFFEAQKATSSGKKINLVLAINYGARDELRRAFGKILALHEKTPFPLEKLTEQLIAEHLDTKDWGDPDLMIRTSGERRISNFLLWQLSYTELSVLQKHWPDFTPHDLLNSIVEFQKRDRRLGG